MMALESNGVVGLARFELAAYGLRLDLRSNEKKKMEAAVGLEPTKTSFADHSIHRVSHSLPRFDTSL
jgi:hypothetical protein